MIISLEGVDRVGKTTQIKALKDHYEAQGKTCYIMKGKVIEGETQKSVESTGLFKCTDDVKFFLYIAEFLSMEETIKSVKDQYDFIFIDRYLESGYVYNLMMLFEKPIKYYKNIFSIFYDNLTLKPDLTILLTNTSTSILQERLSRIKQRGRYEVDVKQLLEAQNAFIRNVWCHKMEGVDVTDKTVEETTKKLITLIDKRRL